MTRKQARAQVARAIQAHCQECWGVNPEKKTCDNPNCGLFKVNTSQKRKRLAATGLKKAIAAECRHDCMNDDFDPRDCTSPNCRLFPWRVLNG